MALDILIVDDENDIRELVTGILSDEGYETRSAGSYIEAIEEIQKKIPNLIILDVWLGEGDRDGLRLLDLIKENYENTPAIMISGHGTIETAVSALKKGAYDFIEKPFDSNRLITSVGKAIETAKLKKENAELKIKAKISNNIIGQSEGVLKLKKDIEKIAPLNGRCVILGPAGSDKETVAREIHRLSPKAKSPFEVLNCSFFTENQLESELFGTFTSSLKGAKIKPGALEKASDGTLFINDLSSASLDTQTKLLKILREGTFSRVGSNEKIPYNARIMAGFPSNIDELIEEGKINDELFHRLSVNTLQIFPLSLRREDITLLIEHYMEQSSKAHNVQARNFTKGAIGILISYSWPGDVMQLKNFIDWTLTINLPSNDSFISTEGLPKDILEEVTPPSGEGVIDSVHKFSGLSLDEAKKEFEKLYLVEQLKNFSGRISKVSKFIGMERSALHRKLKNLNLPSPKSYKKKKS